MGEGIGKAFALLSILAIIGSGAIITLTIYGLFKLITWIL